MTEEVQTNLAEKEPVTGEGFVLVPKIHELEKNQEAKKVLLDMLTYKRPAGSKTERKFIQKYIKCFTHAQDGFGNVIVQVGTDPIIAWCCHTDTVHDNAGFQRLGYDADEVGVWEKDQSNCLGADDTTGVWLMTEMIKAKRPGLYIFHRAEEVGRRGSKHIAEKAPQVLEGIKFAVALDRRGKDSVITYQSGSKCCSREFADSMIDELDLGYKTDPSGSFTDTYSYIDIVPECTNLSVGYKQAHGRYERQDMEFAFMLRDRLLMFDATMLVEKRKPGDNESRYGGTVYSGGGWKHNYHGADTRYWDGVNNRWVDYDDADDDWWKSWDKENGYGEGGGAGTTSTTIPATAGTGKNWQEREKQRWAGSNVAPRSKNYQQGDEFKQQQFSEFLDKNCTGGLDAHGNVTDEYHALLELIKAHPDVAADILEQMGIEAREFAEEIMEIYGVL